MKIYPNKKMIEHLNLILSSQGSKLKYVEDFSDCGTTAYVLIVDDEYIDNTYRMNIQVTNEFENMVRQFFMEYGVENTGYVNTVCTIFAK